MAPASDLLRDRLVERTRALIDIPSVSLDEAEVTAFIRSQLPQGLDTVLDNGDVVFMTTPRRGTLPLVVLAGHTDTVPIEDNVPSTFRDGVVYGRGAADMKGALAVMIEVAHEALRNPPRDFDLGFVFFACEELGSAENVLIPALETCPQLREANFAIVMEPTSNALEVGCQGNLNLKVTFQGEAAHSARPWKGRNAIHDVILTLQDVASSEPHDVDIDGLVFREVAGITTIEGGVARNVVPASASLNINVRYAPSRDPQQVEQAWRQRFDGTTADVEVVSHSIPAPVVVDHAVAKALLRAGADAPVPKLGWTNTADFAAFGVPAINFGPGDPLSAHKRDEQVHQDALLRSAQVLLAFLQDASE